MWPVKQAAVGKQVKESVIPKVDSSSIGKRKQTIVLKEQPRAQTAAAEKQACLSSMTDHHRNAGSLSGSIWKQAVVAMWDT